MANGNGSGEEDGRVQKFNQMVRSIVTLELSAAVIYGFVVDKIGAEVFVPIALLVIQWWFQRDAQRAAMKETAEALKMPPPYTTSTTTSTVATPPPPQSEVKP